MQLIYSLYTAYMQPIYSLYTAYIQHIYSIYTALRGKTPYATARGSKRGRKVKGARGWARLGLTVDGRC
jgi:hypothetical protein